MVVFSMNNDSRLNILKKIALGPITNIIIGYIPEEENEENRYVRHALELCALKLEEHLPEILEIDKHCQETGQISPIITAINEAFIYFLKSLNAMEMAGYLNLLSSISDIKVCEALKDEINYKLKEDKD
jgi:hypothetical protein